MSTQIIYVSGTAKWAKVYQDQLDTKFGAERNIVVYPDEASLIALKSSGSRIEPKEDEEGVYYKFRRDDKGVIKGEEVTFGPPKVIDIENKPFDKKIGNGSKVTVKLSVYDTKKGKGTRLEAVRVDEHVPYESNEDGANYPF